MKDQRAVKSSDPVMSHQLQGQDGKVKVTHISHVSYASVRHDDHGMNGCNMCTARVSSTTHTSKNECCDAVTARCTQIISTNV